MNARKAVFPPTRKMEDLPGRGVWFVVLGWLVSVTLLLTSAYATGGQFISNNTPRFVATATNLGATDAAQSVEVSLWLQPHNRAALDALAQDLYNPRSANYRHWLTSAEIAAEFAPTAAEAKTVQEFFQSNGLKVVAVGPNNFYVRASGTVASVESAFQVQINNYQVGTQVVRANASAPYIAGPAAPLVQSVAGLDSVQFNHAFEFQQRGMPSMSSSDSPPADFSHAASAPDSVSFEAACFPGPTTEDYTTLGGYPKATYSGNLYSSGSAGCGYSPANIYAAYNLNGLYAEGYNGAGQTIVIMDWCGSPTILADANTFSKKFGLPELTASNFSIITYPAPSDCSGEDPQINLEVEWAHAIAPGANIDLIIASSGGFEDMDEATFYAVNSGLGNVISGGYFSPEEQVSSAEANKENLISEIAAVAGIATNYAGSEWQTVLQHSPVFFVTLPADLPYATGVGGVSLGLNSDNSIAFQTDWESWESILDVAGNITTSPSPRTSGPETGAAGGASQFFAKPSFQNSLAGKKRLEPDISWLADPYTGVVMVITQPSQFPPQVWYVSGGVGLATPMFSALWAIANQEAGTALGQAAPYLYSMPSTAITDIVPYGSQHDVTAIVEVSSSQTNRFNSKETMGIPASFPFGEFYSTIWNLFPGEQNDALAISFGGDTSLRSRVGWDEVTGLGTPNAQAFADWFAPAAKNK